MREYIVYRHSRIEACPSPADKMPVLRVQAGSAEEACRLAADQVPVPPEQRLSAEPADQVDAQVQKLNLKAEALEAGETRP